MPDEAQTRVLVATVRAFIWPTQGLDSEREGRAALAMWMRHRHGVVIADFGAMADGFTGPRLAAAIRKCCQSTYVCLMSDDPREDQRQWARAQGADEVIPRTREAIVERLPAWVPDHAFAGLASELVSVDAMNDLAHRVVSELEAAGAGDGAKHAVAEAVRALLTRRHGVPPDAREVACEVGMAIADLDARRVFLRKFGIE
jgi:hypothetical protein